MSSKSNIISGRIQLQSAHLELDKVQHMGAVRRRGVGSHVLDAQKRHGKSSLYFM
jgi:hypothetical protein